MAPGIAEGLSGKRAQLAGPTGLKGIIYNGKTTAIAFFASLGGLVYGYNQGMFAQVLVMHSFIEKTNGYAQHAGLGQGLLTSILELGAWVGTLANGYLADAVGRRVCAVIASAVFTIGVIVQACTENKDYVFAGRFVTGLGVGSLSMIVPLYNAELAAPEVRGALVAVQQLAITFGIMVSFWIGYGTNFIGGTGATQSNAAWLIPVCLQILPALVLAAGMIMFMPQSPRHLMNKGREQECLQTLARLRNCSQDELRVQVEFLKIKALREFEKSVAAAKYPQWQSGSFHDSFMIAAHDWASLFTSPSLRKRTIVAVLTMTFQQWNGVNAINYFAPIIFEGFQLPGNTVSLLATGVVGVLEFLFTIPAVLYVDQFGRNKILIAGAIGMATCHFVVAGLIGGLGNDWPAHRAGGWACVVFIWIYITQFAYSWGPVAWIVVSEVFPLIGLSTSPFIATSQFGTFIFFGCITTIAAVWVYFFVPETKGKTLEEMDELFGAAGFAAADLALKARIEREIGLTQLLGDEDRNESVGGLEKVGKGHEEVADEKDEVKTIG